MIQILEFGFAFLPVLFGGEFSIATLATHLILGMLIYVIVVYFQVRYPDLDAQKSLAMVKSTITKVADIIANNELKDVDKISLLERILMWIIRELDYFYQEQLKEFTHYVRATLKCAKCDHTSECNECDFFLTSLPESKVLIKQRQKLLSELKKEAKKEAIEELKKEIARKKQQIKLQKGGET